MKSKIILAVASLAALALPAVAEDGGRFRDRDHDRGYVAQYEVRPNYSYDRGYYVDRDGDRFRDNERREFRERHERREHESREHSRRFNAYR